MDFANVIATATRGAINDEATGELDALVRELHDTRKRQGGKPKGKITLTLSLQINENDNVELTADVSVKRPATPQTRAILFVNRDGVLSEQDDRQGAFEFKEPTTPAPVVRDIMDRQKLASNDRD